MPPKGAAKAQKANAKAAQAQKAKVVEDKTFGLKNKNKSAKVQQYVTQLQKSVDQRAKQQGLPTAEKSAKDKRKEALEKQKELDDLFAVAIKQPKVPPGADPKSIVCEFFRHGRCQKGFKCKFSHDLTVERKGAKIDLYSDKREGGEDEEHGGEGSVDIPVMDEASNKTDIVCKFFLDAVEKQQYGWFWKCPNGKDCKYRHALPPGYVMKADIQELLRQEAQNRFGIEEQIEQDRAKVDARTPITEQVFQQWRKTKREKDDAALADEAAARAKKGTLTGREIFMQEGFLAEDDLGANEHYEREEEGEAAGPSSSAPASAPAGAVPAPAANGTASSSSQGTPAAGAGGGASGSGAGPGGGQSALALAAEDEQLFLEDDDEDDVLDEDDEEEDLDALEEQLKQASVA